MASPVPARLLYIGGEWVAPVKGGSLPVINPATEKEFARIPNATSEDVDAAVAAATAAFKSGHWSKTTGAYRAKYLRAIATKLREHKAVLAKTETMDCGKPIDEASWDMDDVATCFDYYAGQAEALDGRNANAAAIDVGMSEFDVRVRREALGVVGLITPWNYPLLMAAWKVAPALAAGCTAVLKPSELASLTCLELGAIAAEVGLPPGVLNVITGTGPDAGAPLSAHKGLAKVAFTGSAATGRLVAQAAAANIRPASMELGGKSALIVFEDADVEKAVEWAMFGAFWTNGQICSSTSRLLVHADVEAAFLAQLKKRAEAINVCDPLTEGCRLGPLVSEGQYRKVLSYVEAGKAEGARLVTGGCRPAGAPGGSSGYWVAPTVFAGVKPSMRIWREEIFGPVLSVATFTTEAEAVAAANDSEYGLAGAVISADPDRCKRVAEALECGIVWINCSQPCFCYAPWGGIKNSGHGRELGEWGLDNFLSVKQITKYVSPDIWSWYSPPSKL
ncbi:hypothetical protein HYH02_013035 [Chlamydomonas schloesseri]|uniref:Aldehyde dehydrogenase domain-containing protein n=1 Tax=Chlamydomonas schloesseri TaxID=2026947 RepID=A0A835T4H7_9CHLO|nr:hypothetical protein HYH02_013035 [Chlamydomonas schloesseri]|eukprot:KAG2432315.1 hypothetical protein HYH02_013035 [Chlamydomonas schloesseri]